jgi:bifunctional non-homologous end joining protein LigD
MGFHDRTGQFHLAGRVGTGFDRQWHERLSRELRGREQRANPFTERLRPGVRFVRPDLVAEVEYRRWPQGGQIQQAAFKGIRQDKPPGDVVDERVER